MDDEIRVEIEAVLWDTLTPQERREYQERAWLAIEKAYRGRGRHALLSFATAMFVMAQQNHAGRVENINEEKAKRSKGGKTANMFEAADKAMIYAEWQAWQSEPGRYKKESDFIREMQKRCVKLVFDRSTLYRWKKAGTLQSDNKK